MADPSKHATIHIQGDIEPLIAELERAKAAIRDVQDLAHITVHGVPGAGSGMPRPQPFPSLGTAAPGAAVAVQEPPPVRAEVRHAQAAHAVRAAGGAMPAGGAAAARGGAAGSPGRRSPNWVGMAESLFPVEMIVRRILHPGRQPAAGVGGGPSTGARGATTAATGGPAAIVEQGASLRRSVAEGVARGLAGLRDRLLPAAPTRSTNATAQAGPPTAARRMYDRLTAAGASDAEARQYIRTQTSLGMEGLPEVAAPKPIRPARGGTSASDVVGAALRVGGIGLGLSGVSALAAQGAGLSLQLTQAAQAARAANPDVGFHSILQSPAVMAGVATPSDLAGAMQSMLSTSGRLAKGSNAFVFALRDATAAAQFARAVGITPSAGAQLLGTMQAAGSVAPGLGAQAMSQVYQQAVGSGMAVPAFATALQSLTATLAPVQIPTGAAAMLAGTSRLGQAIGAPMLQGVNAGQFVGGLSNAISSGSAFSGLPGPLEYGFLSALNGGKSLGTGRQGLANLLNVQEGGLKTPAQEAAVLQYMKRLYSSGNYTALDSLLKSMGTSGFGSNLGVSLQKLFQESPQQFNKDISLLTTNPKAAPAAMQQALKQFQNSYGGHAVSVESSVQAAAAKTWSTISGTLSKSLSVLRDIRSGVGEIATILAAGGAISVLGRVGAGGGGGGGGLLGGGGAAAGGGLLDAFGGGAAADAVASGLPGLGAAAGSAVGTGLGWAGGALASAGAAAAPFAWPAAVLAAAGVWGYELNRNPSIGAHAGYWLNRAAGRFLGQSSPMATPSANSQAFVKKFDPLAKKVSKATGFSPAFLLGEWGNETGWGTSQAFLKNNNLEGLKPYGGLTPGLDSKYAGFSTYSQFAQADIATLNSSRYAAARAAARAGADPYAVAHILGQEGFATSPTFASAVASNTAQAARALAALNSSNTGNTGTTQTAFAGGPAATHTASVVSGGQRFAVTVAVKHTGTDPIGVARMAEDTWMWLQDNGHAGTTGGRA